MDLIATGEPVMTQDDTQVHVGIDLQQGTLTLTRNGKDFAAYHALVMFASADASPWAAQHVKFTAHGAGRQVRGFDRGPSQRLRGRPSIRSSRGDLEGRRPRRDLRRGHRHHLLASRPHLM
ncbi:predicted protein [Streptomyces viridochromogenes DSM 40736]|uniref:Predicted protein n=1 Tax=Streptomyces viridochromogenes (strain DSM 40736 / JCM 4977 / BCRC 1201 / Tue 494) TaxID=591159 RepID=D9XHU7_STRVT|nr:predicted protein [Streptomyces viridochromogenes DSM 40736]